MSEAVVAGAGVDLAVRDFGGDGPSALLLHGAGLSLVDMAPLAGHLSADHRVVAMDLRNHGRSGDGPWSWDQVLADLHAVITTTTLVDPILIGHSLGGMLAAMYAEQYGDVVAAVNLDGHAIGSSLPSGMDPTQVAQLRRALRAQSDEHIGQLSQRRTSPEIAAARAAWVDGARTLGLDAALAGEAFNRRLVEGGDGMFEVRPTAAALTQLRDALEDLDLLGVYDRARLPQLVYVAAQDRPDPTLPHDVAELAGVYRRALVRQLRSVADARPNVQVLELEATHGLVYECPELIADQIRHYRRSLGNPVAAVSGHTRRA